MSPQKASKLWGKVPLTAIIDRRISDCGLRIMALMAVEIWRVDIASISFVDLAIALNRSERHIQREVAALVKLGVIAVDKAHNKPNVYRIISPVFDSTKSADPNSHVHHCAKCEKQRKLMKTGYCRSCHIAVGEAAKLRWATIELKERVQRAG